MSATSLTTIRSVGGLLPPDLIGRVLAGQDLDGLTADDFHLELGVTPKEAANRAWSVLTGAWTAYRDALTKLPAGDRATSLTREKWLGVLLRELGFGRVPTTPAGGITADGRSFPVSHEADKLPVHLLGWGVDLDRKTAGVAGAAERAPHAMLQELLNRSDHHLWAILANGSTLRLVRDSSSLVGQAYVEFDLQAMFDGEQFSDFVALYLFAHQTRFEPVDPDAGPEDCWLERWRADAVETGARALGQLRDGVKAAIESLGTGFLRHPDNSDLRASLEQGGGLDLADYHRALLRLVYRLLFCFVAEDRGLLLDPNASETARARYTAWFSTSRLRHIASRRRGTRHSDLWQSLTLVIDGLGRDEGRPELGLPGIGGLFDTGPLDVVTGCELSNDALLAAIRHLCVIQPREGGPRRNVDYRNLGAEELGGIYESLLELVPRADPSSRVFSLEVLAGNERKTSGAYYTPTSLIDCLLDSALDPLLDRAEASPDPEDELLSLTVCDPACGSGHFLVAAARRIAHRLARVRAEGAEPPVAQAQDAMHDVVARCIFGVDLNPMAAELAMVSLWLEGLSAGRPLGFLRSHIRVGNALLGTTPALLANGIPDEAFAALEGDERKTVTALKRQNKTERDAGQGDLFSSGANVDVDNRKLAEKARLIDNLTGLSLADVHLAEQRHRELEASPELRRERLLADTWCAAFVAPKRSGEPTITNRLLTNWQTAPLPTPDGEGRSEVDVPASDEHLLVDRLAAEYRFFHWYLEFPQIFEADPGEDGPGWRGGFSCVLGNPPWEHVELKEQEFFAARDPEIAAAAGATRKRLIKDLGERNPRLLAEYEAAKRVVDGERQLLGKSGRYPLCGRGRINTYAVFAEHNREILGPSGRLGVILPTGIATDATTQHFFKAQVVGQSLVSLFDFENRQPLFADVDSRFKFCLLTLAGTSDPVDAADFAFFAHDPSDLARDGVRFTLTPQEIQLLNPNTGTCPVFRSRRDAEITLAIYRRVPVLIRHGDPDGNPWGVSFMQGLFNMTSDSHLFHAREELESDGWILNGNVFEKAIENSSGGGVGSVERFLPLYEAKMIHHFDTRWATYENDGTTRRMTESEKAEHLAPLPRFWVAEGEVTNKVHDKWDKRWFLGWRDITNNTNERTVIATLVPFVAVGNNMPLLLADVSLSQVALLQGVLSSFVVDFVARQKTGGTHLNFFLVEQLPIASPTAGLVHVTADWIASRVDRLNGWIADPGERAQIRAEVDAYFFHLYGLARGEVEYVMESFPIVKRNDEAAHGTYRTKNMILEAFDSLSEEVDQP